MLAVEGGIHSHTRTKVFWFALSNIVLADS